MTRMSSALAPAVGLRWCIQRIHDHRHLGTLVEILATSTALQRKAFELIAATVPHKLA